MSNFNKWTLGLAAIGAVSMTSAVRAQRVLLVDDTPMSGYIKVSNATRPSGRGPAPARKCRLHGCDKLTNHNGGYCSAEHKWEDDK